MTDCLAEGGTGASVSVVRRLRLALLVTVAVVALLVVAAGAQAAQTHQLTSQPCPSCWGDPEGVAVDQSGGATDGHIWVTSASNGYFSLLDGNGNVLGAFFPPGLVSPTAAAVDNATGDVYIIDSGTNTLYKYDGTPVGGSVTEIWHRGAAELPALFAPDTGLTGVSVNPVTGHVFVKVSRIATVGDGVIELDSAGNYVDAFGFGQRSPSRLAVGGGGELYLVESPNAVGNSGVDEYSPTGQFIRRLDNGNSIDVSYDALHDQVVVNDGTYIVIYDASGAQVDKFGVGDLVSGTGVAINSATNVVYALDRGDGTGDNLDIFSPVSLPELSLVAAAPVGATSVTVHGHVGLAGAGNIVSCQFEYGTSTAYGASMPCDPAVPYSADTDVSAVLSGLDPATEYHYRLVAANANGSARTTDGTFISAPGAPVVDSATVADRGSDHARIDAMVRVMGADTTVRVEYGTTTAYGNTASAAGTVVKADGPADRAPKLVSVELSGLSLDTTYHYRVVATNSADTTRAADGVLHTQPAPEGLPDGRGYELVTPVAKDGHSVVPGYSLATGDGSAVTFQTVGAVGSSSTGSGGQVVERRLDGTWTTDSVHLRADVIDALHYGLAQWPSDDLSKLAFSGIGGFAKGADSSGLYISTRDTTVLASPSALSPTPWGPSLRSSLSGDAYAAVPAGAAPDLNPTYFSFDGALLAEDSARVPNLAAHDALGFYEFKDGQLQEAGRLPDGSLDPFGAAPAGASNSAPEPAYYTNHFRDATAFNNQVSTDGTRAFFVSPAPGAGSPQPSQLYVHREGAASLLISRSESTHAPAQDGVIGMTATGSSQAPEQFYAFASANGRFVFFESDDALTADAPSGGAVKGYLFDVDHDRLTYVPGVVGSALAVSADGSHVFFETGAGDIKVWIDGHGVTTVAPAVSGLVAASATSDGSVLVFEPDGPLSGFNTGGNIEVYRYDTAAAHLACVSCPAEGASPTGGALLAGDRNPGAVFAGDSRAGSTGQLRGPHLLTEDGSRIFFDTTDQLVATDTNAVRDVYEWEDGKAHLISQGRGSRSSWLLDNSASGDDVFFATADGLDPRDTDGSYDVYDARVGGGVTAPISVTECRGACQGARDTSPGSVSLPTAQSSPGNVVASRASAPTVKVRGKKAHGSTITLSVAVSGKGRIAVSGPTVGTVKRATTKKASYAVSVRLTAAARKSLRLHHRLVVRLRVSFTSSAGKSSVTTVTLTAKA